MPVESSRASRRNSWWWRRSWWWAGIIVPHLVLLIFGYESWVGRLIVGAYILTLALFIACVFLVFSPSERLITPGGKLRHLKSDTPRRVVEILARTLGVALAIFLIVSLTNYGFDIWEILSRNGPPTISGKLTDQSYTAVAAWCYQDITILGPDGSSEQYSLFFHLRVPIGRNCKFRILPRSKTILSIEVSP
jgi:hypothetical protein